MRLLKKLTINQKLVLIIITISTISLLIAAITFTLFQIKEIRNNMIVDITTMAMIIADNSQASLAFDISNDAKQVLNTLDNEQAITTAAIFKPNGEIFATYKKTNSPEFVFPESQEDHYKFNKNSLTIFHTIKDSTGILGSVYIQSNLNRLNTQIKKNILMMILIIILALVISYFISYRLQHFISSPILKLAEVTKTIKNEKDYSIRVNRDDYVEIQQLCDGFNSMLQEIQSRDEHLQQLATYDALTNLPNRKYFDNQLKQAISRGIRKSQLHAILFLDLDRFKHINDSLGHNIGDELLIRVARRLETIIRDDDVIARFGGDEFIFLLQDIPSSHHSADVADRIIEILNEPYDLIGHNVVTTPSIGIVLFPEHGTTTEDLLKNADTAMYQAKKHGGNRYWFYTESMNIESKKRLKLEEDLRNGLTNFEFILHYQPKLGLNDKQIAGMEALVRWNKNKSSYISPNEFIPIAEETGLIIHLGNQILEQAVQQTKVWLNHDLLKHRVAINISPKQFKQTDFLNHLIAVLDKFNLPPEYIELEITEAVIMENTSEAITAMKKIKDYGITLAMDDFGSGYSSLSHLKKFPIDTLKVDRSFIIDMDLSVENRNIVKTIIDLAHALKLNVVAEGVETEKQLSLLKDMGCNCIQGYLFSKPLTCENMEELLQEQKQIVINPGYMI